jgi:hypothetical protein
LIEQAKAAFAQRKWAARQELHTMQADGEQE